MASAPPLTEAERQRILDLHAAGKSRNDIAADVNRSGAVVSRVVKEAGLSFDRASTHAATQARKVDLAAKRAELRAKLLNRADEFIEQMDKPAVVFNFGGKDNTFEQRRLNRPPVKDIRDLMQSASIAITAELRIAQADNDQGDAAARSLLTRLADALEIDDEPPADD